MHLSDLVASSAYRIDNLIRSRFFYFVRVNLHSIYEHLKVKRAARHSYIVILKQYYGVDLSRMYFAIANLFGSGKLIFSDSIDVLRIITVNGHIILPNNQLRLVGL